MSRRTHLSFHIHLTYFPSYEGWACAFPKLQVLTLNSTKQANCAHTTRTTEPIMTCEAPCQVIVPLSPITTQSVSRPASDGSCVSPPVLRSCAVPPPGRCCAAKPTTGQPSGTINTPAVVTKSENRPPDRCRLHVTVSPSPPTPFDTRVGKQETAGLGSRHTRPHAVLSGVYVCFCGE